MLGPTLLRTWVRGTVQTMLHALPPPPFWILHIDGSAMPNPGRMAIGAVLTAPDGEAQQLGHMLAGSGCNNEAELRALQAGLQLAHSQGAVCIRIYTDSRWLLEQLAPSVVQAQRVRATVRLAEHLDAVRHVLQGFSEVQWRWIPRHHNTEADALARKAILTENA